jgi:hypothetical protein
MGDGSGSTRGEHPGVMLSSTTAERAPVQEGTFDGRPCTLRNPMMAKMLVRGAPCPSAAMSRLRRSDTTGELVRSAIRGGCPSCSVPRALSPSTRWKTVCPCETMRSACPRQNVRSGALDLHRSRDERPHRGPGRGRVPAHLRGSKTCCTCLDFPRIDRRRPGPVE